HRRALSLSVLPTCLWAATSRLWKARESGSRDMEMRRSWFGASFVLLSAVLLTFGTQTPSPTLLNTPATDDDSTYAGAHDNYVGDQACRSCHWQKVEGFHQTAHYLTSRLPSKESILG